MRKLLILIGLCLTLNVGNANHFVIKDNKKVEHVIYDRNPLTSRDTTIVDGKILTIETPEDRLDECNGDTLLIKILYKYDMDITDVIL